MIKTTDLYKSVNEIIKPLFDSSVYPFEIISALQGYLTAMIERGISGFTRFKRNILLAPDVKITRGAVIEGPLIICCGAEIRTGAYIRGNSFIGEGCVVGNSTEVKNSVLLDCAKAPHFNYVGDSILGYMSHIGAGVILSNLKSDGSYVKIKAEEEYATKRKKLGSFLGDHSEIGCGSVLNPGTVVGIGSRAYPLIALRGVYPNGVIIKSESNITPIA